MPSAPAAAPFSAAPSVAVRSLRVFLAYVDAIERERDELARLFVAPLHLRVPDARHVPRTFILSDAERKTLLMLSRASSIARADLEALGVTSDSMREELAQMATELEAVADAGADELDEQ